MEARTFLDAVLGYTRPDKGTQGKTGGSQERPARLATIDPGYASGLPQVIFDGETGLTGKGYTWLAPYTPVAGDRVLLIPIGQNYVIQGAVSSTYGDTGWLTDSVTPSTGITLTTPVAYRRVGNMVYVKAANITIASLNIPTSGDVGNLSLFSLPAGFSPTTSFGSGQVLSSGQSGRVASFYVASGGIVALAAVVPDSAQTGTVTATNFVVSVGGSFLVG